MPADADIRHRCAVRLTAVTTQNAQGQPLVDPLFEEGTGHPIVSVSQQPHAGDRDSVVGRRMRCRFRFVSPRLF